MLKEDGEKHQNIFQLFANSIGSLFTYKSPNPFDDEFDPRYLRFHTNRTLMVLAQTKSHLSKKKLIDRIILIRGDSH